MADFIVTIDGDRRVDVDIKPGDLVKLERTYGVDLASLGDSVKVEHTMFLLWCALKRTGDIDVDFDAFLDRVDDFDPGEAAPLAQPAD